MTHCDFIPPFLLEHLGTTQTLTEDARLRDRRRQAPATSVPDPRATGRFAVYDSASSTDLPGELTRSDGDPAVGDEAVDEAHDDLGPTWDLFDEVFGRQSFDDEGTPVIATVHYGQAYSNAFWDGSQLVFGDGDGKVFGRFTKPIDVLAHEFTHGVTQHTANLTYDGQSGALNESVSDCFASMVKQRVLGQGSEDADWLIGAGIFLPGVNATALRSMRAPGTAYDDPQLGKDPQVGSMADYVETAEDNGGVHINSGIPNRAFYLAATGIGGNAWETPGAIWYATITSGIGPDTDFAVFAQATVEAATSLYGADSPETQAVTSAWAEVGVIGDSPDSPTKSTPPGTVVAVVRTGGVAGMRSEGRVDLEGDEHGAEVARLLSHIDFAALQRSEPQPDRYTFTLAIGDEQVSVAEQDMPADLVRAITLILGE